MAKQYIEFMDIVTILKNQIGYGKTQMDLAKEIGVSRSYLSEVLAGKKKLSNETLESMGYQTFYRRRGSEVKKIAVKK